MNSQTNRQFSISEDVLSQEVNGETVLLDLEGEMYFGLDEVGTRIWQQLQSGATLSGIVNTLGDEYDVSREQLEVDVDELLGKLIEAGLITGV